MREFTSPGTPAPSNDTRREDLNVETQASSAVRHAPPGRIALRLRAASFALFGAGIVLLSSGCTTSGLIVGSGNSHALPATVRGGNQPIHGAAIQLYAVGTEGVGSAATPLLSDSVVTDEEGAFALSGKYHCPSDSTQVYIVATGGDPGLSAHTSNQSIALMSALGSCGSLTPDTQITINEVTTVAGVWALSPYMRSSRLVGATQETMSGLEAGFQLAANFTDLSSGLAPGKSIPSGDTVPAETINTAADILAACVNTGGGAAGDGSPCGLLFSLTTANGQPAPKNTLDAALAIAAHPTENVKAIYNLLAAESPFEPQLPEPPPNWVIALGKAAAPSTPVFASTRSAKKVIITIADASSSAIVHFTANGATPTATSPVYSTPINVTTTTTLKAIAFVGTTASPVVTQTFTVSPVAANLVFLAQPQSALIGKSLGSAIKVGVLDDNGNLFPSANAAVKIILGDNPAGTSLAGTVTVTPVNGVATFTNLSVPVAGTYTLQAGSSGLGAATSSTFDVTEPQTSLPLVQAKSADAFVDSIGIDVHFNYYGSIYTNNTPLMIKSLKALGIRHLRDAMCWQGSNPQATYYLLHQQLGSLGFKTDYVPGIDQPMSQVSLFPSLVPDMEAVEPANEYDIAGDPNWAADIKRQAKAIYQTIRSSSKYDSITVLAPSLAYQTDAPALGDVGAFADAGNLHGYFGGYNPGSSTTNPSIYLKEVGANTPGKPIWVTETGYFAQPGPIFGTYGVSAETQAIYSPRDLLEYSNAGAARTYLYELADDFEPGEDVTNYHWGLMNSDGSQKPAFGAVANLLTMLTDPGVDFTPAALAYQLENANASVHQALFQKRDGSWYLALWLEELSYDFVHQRDVTEPSQNIILQVSGHVVLAEQAQWSSSGTVATTTLNPANAIPLTVTDRLQVIKLEFNDSLDRVDLP